MKKFVTILMAMVMAMVMCVSPVSAVSSLSGGFKNLKGDINMDGYITEVDLTYMRAVLRGEEMGYPVHDVNGDGAVTTADYVALANIYAVAPDVEMQNIIRTDLDIAASVSYRAVQLIQMSNNTVIVEFDGIIPNHTLERLGCTNILVGKTTKYVKAKISRAGGLTQFSAYYA